MVAFAGILLALAGPAISGWLLVRRVWPEAPQGIRVALGTGLGTGLVGTLYFLALTRTNSSRLSLIFSEALLVLGIVFLARRPRSTKVFKTVEAPLDRKAPLMFLVVSILSATSFLLLLDRNLHGQWDATAIWNMKAKFIALSPDPLSRILDSALSRTHTDYPLLLPSLIARGWQYAGGTLDAMPVAVAVLFTACTFLLLVQSLKILVGSQQAYLTGSVLATTPFFLELGSFQYADNVVAFFLTAAIAMYCLHDTLQRADWRLPFIGGLSAGIVLCTKSEAILTVLALYNARLILLLWRESPRGLLQEARGTLLGITPGLLTFLSFKMWPAQPDPLSSQFTLATLLFRLPQLNLHWDVLKGMVWYGTNFGAWLLLPVPFLVAHIVIARRGIGLRKGHAAWLTPALAIAASLAGYYMVYFLTPYSLAWHLESSFNRLLTQLWPSALLLYSMVVAPPVVATPSLPLATDLLSRRRWGLKLLSIYAVTLIAATLGLLAMERLRALPVDAHLELSAKEVVAGRDSYVLTIKELPNQTLMIRYSIDNDPPQSFSVRLDSNGQVRFDVPPATRRGKYRFLGFARGTTSWNVSDREITVK
jgi:hypothetical protein